MIAPWPHGDPRDVVHRVLADPRFRTAPQRAADKSWLDVVLDALKALVHRVFGPLGQLTGNATLTRIIGIAVLALVLGGLAYVVVRYTARWNARRERRAAGNAQQLDAGADAGTLFASALAAAADGHHHEAAALLWASALRALDERGRVRYDAARTPGEWRRVVRDPNFDALARDAVVALFGERGADAALVARMRDSYDRVVPA